MAELSGWISSLDRSIPLHITRFFPRYKMKNKRPTDISLMHRLRDTALKDLTQLSSETYSEMRGRLAYEH
jgi:pyruvate formate lyase activating enzyme